jgi:hypothetical protein
VKIIITKGGAQMPSISADAIVKAAPALGLTIALVLLVAVPMPPANADIVKLIAAGFLGALTQGRLQGNSQ